MDANAEKIRLADDRRGKWKLFGPYLSERQWGTVREDYSPDGEAWNYFPHDHARSRAYRWGEDGIAGISDEQQQICLSLALWNGVDPILKERLFGLTNTEGNHGEDVKELYYYLDATPTHSYLKMLYKYPQRAFPYDQLVDESRSRGREKSEFELLDSGVFDEDRYWDVFVEYAKADTDDVLMRVTVHNRGPETATIHLLPQLWFRNTWSWKSGTPKPHLCATGTDEALARHQELGDYRLFVSPGHERMIFCDNETNVRRHGGEVDAHGYFKDAFHERIVHGRQAAVNPNHEGTKAGVHYILEVPAGGSSEIRLRLVAGDSGSKRTATEMIHIREGVDDAAANPSGKIRLDARHAFTGFDTVFSERIREADEFYASLQHEISDADARAVQRQALAGMIWSKQFYNYDVAAWLRGDPGQPAPLARKRGRNAEWTHLNNSTVMSMPDKWEYPWYAAWDLSFHTIPLALVDAEFAKSQLVSLTREWYMHPNGQLPAYEWALGDVNPPVHAWATWRVFQMDRKARRDTHPGDKGDLEFLERVFHKLMLNFTWWVNRKDAQGRNIFQGGFLGLDNIGVFDRSAPLPTGGHINQADGTSWMAMYCLNLLRISLELAKHNRVYEDIATKFFEHFLDIAAAINGVGEGALGLWDEQDEFYYDHLCLADGQNIPLKVRSMVGLIPLFAVEVIEPALLKKLPTFNKRMKWYLKHRPDLANLVSRWQDQGTEERHLLSLLRGHRMKCLLRRMLDETEFLGDYGVRALSKVHEREPYRFDNGGHTIEVRYWPGESENGLFGGNSNWRGPIWMPVNFLLIEALQKFHHYYGEDFKIECPTGSGNFVTLNDAANEIANRLCKLFLKGQDGQRPALKGHPKLASDPHFKDHVLFHEYFHGDSGVGVGASHQTGWTGLIAKLLMPRRETLQPGDTAYIPRAEELVKP